VISLVFKTSQRTSALTRFSISPLFFFCGHYFSILSAALFRVVRIME